MTKRMPQEGSWPGHGWCLPGGDKELSLVTPSLLPFEQAYAGGLIPSLG